MAVNVAGPANKEASSPERPPERVTDERYTLRLRSRPSPGAGSVRSRDPSPVTYAGAPGYRDEGPLPPPLHTSDDDDVLADCPQPVITFGWRRDWQGRRHRWTLAPCTPASSSPGPGLYPPRPGGRGRP